MPWPASAATGPMLAAPFAVVCTMLPAHLLRRLRLLVTLMVWRLLLLLVMVVWVAWSMWAAGL